MDPKAAAIKIGQERLTKYMNELRPDEAAAVQKRYDSLVAQESPEPALYSHVYSMILPLAAVYLTLLETRPQDEAKAVSFDLLHRLIAEPGKRKIQRMMKIPGLYRLLMRFFPRLRERSFAGSPEGFSIEVKNQTTTDYLFHINRCPYLALCTKLGIPELTEAFCITDEICYENMHKHLHFERKGTLAKGNEACDFHFWRD